MKRHVDMKEISDGRKYHRNDMVKLGCNDCEGCSECCRNTGDSIVLDPWDIYMLTVNLNSSFEALLGKYIELHVVDGVVLPNIRIAGGQKGCGFLNEEGRCSIHAFRPGFCRLFPLGRLYEEGSFTYFLQTQECKKERRTKQKISKWLEISDIARYEEYINVWHYFVREFQEKHQDMTEEQLRSFNMRLLQLFYQEPYKKDDFYGQFTQRLQWMRTGG